MTARKKKKTTKKKTTKKKATRYKSTKTDPYAGVKKKLAAKKKAKSQLGRTARQYGHAFENLIKNKVKKKFEAYPWAERVRRSDQSHRAWLPDVAEWPMLWPECQTTEHPNPDKKMQQGEADCIKHGFGLIPICVWRKKRAQSINVTLDARALFFMMELAGDIVSSAAEHFDELGRRLVTMDFEDFLVLYDQARLWELTAEFRMPQVPDEAHDD